MGAYVYGLQSRKSANKELGVAGHNRTVTLGTYKYVYKPSWMDSEFNQKYQKRIQYQSKKFHEQGSIPALAVFDYTDVGSKLLEVGKEVYATYGKMSVYDDNHQEEKHVVGHLIKVGREWGIQFKEGFDVEEFLSGLNEEGKYNYRCATTEEAERRKLYGRYYTQRDW